MPINADKPHLWKADVAASIDLYNDWFMRFGPQTYRATRAETTVRVQEAIELTHDLTSLNPAILKAHPSILPVLRMSTAPPIARDRLAGLVCVNRHLVQSMESGKVPTRMSNKELDRLLEAVARVLIRQFDYELLPWLKQKTRPTRFERFRASTIVADRLCGTMADSIIQAARRQRQIRLITKYLRERGYKYVADMSERDFANLQPGTFTLQAHVISGIHRAIHLVVDVVLQPHAIYFGGLPVVIRARSFDDPSRAYRRGTEEVTYGRLLRARFGADLPIILFLGGCVDARYLGHVAAEQIDWIWEHRIEDLSGIGV